MANTEPTPVGFLGAVKLCVLFLFAPARFLELETQDTVDRDSRPTQAQPPDARLRIIRRALIQSLLLVVGSGVAGAGFGLLLGRAFGCASGNAIAWSQAIAAGLLLWGTLFVRGWEIGTWCGVTYTERVNQWLYRALYCVGTAALVMSLVWPQCQR